MSTITRPALSQATRIRPHTALEDEPREDGSDRFAIYVVIPNWTRGSEVDHADGRRRLAETSQDGIGIALVTLRDEEQITNNSRVGVLDRLTRTWIVNPYARGDQA